MNQNKSLKLGQHLNRKTNFQNISNFLNKYFTMTITFLQYNLHFCLYIMINFTENFWALLMI